MSLYTIEERKKIILDVAAAIKDSLEAYVDICRRLDVANSSIYKWRDTCPEVDEEVETYERAKEIRAAAYVSEGRKILDEVEVFYDVGGRFGGIKDSNAAVNKARAQMDMRFRLAECLDPRNWSSLKDEIRQIQSELKHLKMILDAKNR